MDVVKKTIRMCLGTAAYCAPLTLLAANLPVTPQADPSLQRDRIENQRRDERIQQRARQVQIPSLRGDTLSTQELAEDDQRVVLSSISITPSVFIEREVLAQLAQQYVDREISFADLNGLLRAINTHYEEQGQLTARALIPPQTLENGVLHILLVEARVEKITWQGRQGRVKDSFYEQRLPIQSGEVLDSPELMKEIQRFNATSIGPQVSAGLTPGQAFGTTQLGFEAFEPKPFSWQAFSNNYGNESSGRNQFGAYLGWFSPSGVADEVNATLMGSKGTNYLSVRYTRPINRYNGVVYGEGSVNRLKIKEGALKDLNIIGDSESYTLGFSQPWWINEHWLLTAGAAYNRESSESSIDGVALSETDVDSYTLQGQAEWRHDPWYARYEQRLRYAVARNSISGDQGNFKIATGNAYVMRRFGERFEGVGRLSWQWATDPERLPSSLSYQLGGVSSIRGYDAGIIASPHGVAASLETYWRVSPSWQPFIFYDHGEALKLGTHNQQLSSTGFGVNYNWKSRVSVSAVFAHTLINVVPDQDKNQFLVQFTFR